MKRSAEAKTAQYVETMSFRLPIRHDLHLARKLWHMLMGLLIVGLYSAGISRTLGVILLASFLGLDLLIEGTRLRSSTINEKVMRFWGPFMRAHETSQFSTIPHYIAAVLLAILIFPKPVAVLSILYLACGDPVASLTGILYGHKGPRFSSGKTLIGTLGGITICGLITLFYLQAYSIPMPALLGVTVVGGLAGGMAELLPFEIDDNFTIPVVSGFILWLAFMVFGI